MQNNSGNTKGVDAVSVDAQQFWLVYDSFPRPFREWLANTVHDWNPVQLMELWRGGQQLDSVMRAVHYQTHVMCRETYGAAHPGVPAQQA